MDQNDVILHGFRTLQTTLSNHQSITCLVKRKSEELIFGSLEETELYAPYRYHLHVSIPHVAFSYPFPTNVQLDIQVIDAITGCEIFKNLEPIYKGAARVVLSLSARKDVLFEHVGKFQIADCSYHNGMHPFVIRITFTETTNLQVFLVRESRPFLVMARSTVRRKISKKKKQEKAALQLQARTSNEEQNVAVVDAGSIGAPMVPVSFQEFETKLGKLLEDDFRKLDSNDQKKAITFMTEKVQALVVDPSLSSSDFLGFDDSASSAEERDFLQDL